MSEDEKPTTISDLLARDEVRECLRVAQEDILANGIEECTIFWVRQLPSSFEWRSTMTLDRLVYFLEALKALALRQVTQE